MAEHVTTHFLYELPNGTRRYTSSLHCRSRRNLRQVLTDAGTLPDTSKIWWGEHPYKPDRPYTGFMLEVIHKTVVSLYRVSGFDLQPIGTSDIRTWFTQR